MAKRGAGLSAALHKAWQTALAFVLLGVLTSLAACSGESEGDKASSFSAPYPAPDPLLYEISKGDGKVEGWLFGTIHALPRDLPRDARWRTRAIDHAATNADYLLVEVASLGQDDSVRQAFVELSQSPDLLPLTQRVSPELQDDLDAMIEELGTSRAVLRSSEDWAAAIMLAQVDAPGEPEFGVDRALIEEFAGRKVIGFETAREQLGIFDRLAPEDQRALLEGTVKDWASGTNMRDKLLRAWIAGDTKALEDATTQGIMADPELRNALLVQRNVDWMAQLTPMLEDSPKPLIAVGAAHLVGPDGLVALLEMQGYTAKRIAAK